MFTPLMDFLVTVCWVIGIWAILVLIPVIMTCVIVVEEKKLKMPQKVYVAFTAAFVVIPMVCAFFVLIINPYFFAFGYATDNFEVVANEENVLWGMDYWILPGGDAGGGSSIVYRIQGLDLDNGRKMFRRPIADLLEVHGENDGLVWASADQYELVGIDIRTGQTRVIVNEEYLTKNFPELAEGVHEYRYNRETRLVDVVSKVGTKISVDPVKKVKVEAKPVEENAERYEMYDSGISENYQTILTLKGDTVEKLADGEGNILNDDVTFLEGKFILHDRAAGKVVILSYATLDKEEFILRSFNEKGELLWESDQKKLGVGDIFIPHPPFEKALYYQGNAVVAFNGFVISLDGSTGQLQWRVRM